MYKKVTFLVTLIGVMGLLLFTFYEGHTVSASDKTLTTNLSIKVTSSGDPIQNGAFLAGIIKRLTKLLCRVSFLAK